MYNNYNRNSQFVLFNLIIRLENESFFREMIGVIGITHTKTTLILSSTFILYVFVGRCIGI